MNKEGFAMSFIENIGIRYIVKRLNENSTWTGLCIFISGIIGAPLSPDVATLIMSVGMSIGGFLAVVLPDKLAKSDKKDGQ